MAHEIARFTGYLARHLTLGLGCLALCAPLQAADKLTLCFENKVVPPWRTPALGGLNFELLKRVESKLDLQFDYQLLPWKRCLAKLQANQVDGAFSVSHTDQRRQYGVFPGLDGPDPRKRMHSARYYLLRKKGSRIDWDGKQFHHADGKIGFQLGYSVGDMLRTLKVPVDERNDTLHNVGRMLIAGRLAGAAVFDSDAETLMRGPLGPKLELLPTPLVEKPYYLMLSNRLVQSRPELCERIWKAIEEVRNGREYGKLVHAAGASNAR